MVHYMTLGEYLSWKKLTPEAFAKRIGVSRAAVSRYRSGDRRPEWKVIKRIVKETNGLVTADSFLTGPSSRAA